MGATERAHWHERSAARRDTVCAQSVFQSMEAEMAAHQESVETFEMMECEQPRSVQRPEGPIADFESSTDTQVGARDRISPDSESICTRGDRVDEPPSSTATPPSSEQLEAFKALAQKAELQSRAELEDPSQFARTSEVPEQKWMAEASELRIENEGLRRRFAEIVALKQPVCSEDVLHVPSDSGVLRAPIFGEAARRRFISAPSSRSSISRDSDPESEEWESPQGRQEELHHEKARRRQTASAHYFGRDMRHSMVRVHDDRERFAETVPSLPVAELSAVRAEFARVEESSKEKRKRTEPSMHIPEQPASQEPANGEQVQTLTAALSASEKRDDLKSDARRGDVDLEAERDGLRRRLAVVESLLKEPARSLASHVPVLLGKHAEADATKCEDGDIDAHSFTKLWSENVMLQADLVLTKATLQGDPEEVEEARSTYREKRSAWLAVTHPDAAPSKPLKNVSRVPAMNSVNFVKLQKENAVLQSEVIFAKAKLADFPEEIGQVHADFRKQREAMIRAGVAPSTKSLHRTLCADAPCTPLRGSKSPALITPPKLLAPR